MAEDHRDTSPEETNKIIEERKEKLKELRLEGNAFPNDFRRDHLADELHKEFGDVTKESLNERSITVSCAGRMMFKRVMGKASFCSIHDMSGKIQLFITDNLLGDTYTAF